MAKGAVAGPKVRAIVHRAIPLRQQAMRYAQQSEQPVIKAIRGEQHQYDADQAQRQANAAGLARALGEMLKGIGPATESAYTNAAGATAGFAKGFADAEAHQAADSKASMASFLAKMGISGPAADQALSHVGNTADVLYGTTGAAPATALEREGAAFTGAANELPQLAAGLGEQNLNQLQTGQNAQDSKFLDQIAAERAKIPSLANQLLQQMITNGRADQSLQIQKNYLNQATRRNQISATGVDPVTHQAKPGYYKDKSGRVLPDGYVWRNGHPVRQSSKSAKGFDFNGALSSASPHINTAAAGLVTTQKSTDPLAGLPGHPEMVTTHPPYAKAAAQLFSQFKYLLRQVPAKQRAAAKRALVAGIRDALVGVGITPPGVAPPPTPAPVQPGVNP